MKILLALTYYRPYISGLTVYAQRIAEELVRRGHQVTVVSSRYMDSLPLESVENGVSVVRVPVDFWISKGAIMLGYPKVVRTLMAAHDVAQISLPNTFIEALALPLYAKKFKKPVVATYQCDLNLPPGITNRIVDEVVFWSNFCAGTLVDKIVSMTEDYVSTSRFLSCFRGKLEIIPPPVKVEPFSEEDVSEFKRRYAPNGETLIGFAGRLAAEKGLEYLLSALPKVRAVIPDARVVCTGNYQSVIGEERYRNMLLPLIQQLGDAWQFLGVLPDDRMSAFFAACGVLVMPSINSTEAFGMVQVESMLCGTPVVASNLPGVRVPVQITGMGRIAQPKDSDSLAQAIIEVLQNRPKMLKPRAEIEQICSVEACAIRYERLFESLVMNR